VLAITRKDYPIVQSVSFLIVAGFLIVNAIVDGTYAAIDPRTQLSRTR
jgi:ABC-type dipeptide/oligopeptide/nickel transport system permease component